MALSSSDEQFLTVHQTGYKILGWLSLIVLGGFTALSWRAGAYRPAFIFLFFVLLGIYVLLGSGRLQMNANSISYRLPLARYFMRWDEVQKIEIDPQAGNLVFIGTAKRLAINGPALWTGPDKAEMNRLVAQQIELLGITVVVTAKAMLRWSKNTKVRSGGGQV